VNPILTALFSNATPDTAGKNQHIPNEKVRPVGAPFITESYSRYAHFKAYVTFEIMKK
jgi:hypothetical protein